MCLQAPAGAIDERGQQFNCVFVNPALDLLSAALDVQQAGRSVEIGRISGDGMQEDLLHPLLNLLLCPLRVLLPERGGLEFAS